MSATTLTQTITDSYYIRVKKKSKWNGLEEHCRVATRPKTSTASKQGNEVSTSELFLL